VVSGTGYPDGTSAMRIKAAGTSKKLTQIYTPSVTGAAADKYDLHFWSMGENLGGSGVQKVQVKIYYKDGSKQTVTHNLPSGAHGWTDQSLVVDPTKPYTKIEVIFLFSRASGTLWLDAVRFILQ
jgi:hypothetical protein